MSILQNSFHHIANSFVVGGIHRAYLIDKDGELRVFIPEIYSSYAIEFYSQDEKFNVNSSKVLEQFETFPKPIWNVPNSQAQQHETPVHPCWVTFENNDIERPVIMGWCGEGIMYHASSGGMSDGMNNGMSGYANYSAGDVTDVTGGTEVNAKFTAYYATSDNYSSAENILEGGPIAAYNEEVLDYTKNTCAAPPEIPFNEYIKITDISNSKDLINKLYRVNDRGGAIKVENGVYHIDLLVKDKTTADAFGIQYGKIIIHGEPITSLGSSNLGPGEGAIYGLSWVCDTRVVTSNFGPRNISYGSKNHKGLDIGASYGSNIYAAADGVATYVNADDGYYGYVDINHGIINGDKIFTRYAHISESRVTNGQTVKRGDLIALSGDGRGHYAAHLHFEIVVNGVQIDPRKEFTTLPPKI